MGKSNSLLPLQCIFFPTVVKATVNFACGMVLVATRYGMVWYGMVLVLATRQRATQKMVPVDGHQLVVTVMSAPQCNVTDMHNFQTTNISKDICPSLE